MTPMYCAAVECPDCGRTPNVRFSEAEVRKAKRERQAAHVLNVQCTRCGRRYWIQARDIAVATLEKVGKKPKKSDAAQKGLDASDEAAIA